MQKIIAIFIKILFKINLIRFLAQTIKYKIHIGNYVNIVNDGIIKFTSRNITVRDFSEIVIYKNGVLQVNDNVFMGKNVEIGARNIHIAENTSIQNNCILLGNIRIGRDCLFGPSIYVSSGFHYFKYRPELLIHDQDILASSELDTSQNKIIIEDDVWIGKDVVIINNVTIGKGSVIGANSIINKNVDPYTIVAGTPQKVIGFRLDFENNIPTSLHGNVEKDYPYFYKGFDYSLSSIEKNHYVAIVDYEIIFCLKNDLDKKFITLELITENNERCTISHNKEKLTIDSAQKIKFNVGNVIQDKYHFTIEGCTSNILIKRVYFDNE